MDVFFDSGSSLHLATDDFIRKAGLKLVSNSTANFIVTGGEQFKSGLFSLLLKLDKGFVFDITVQGISRITSDMEMQNLKAATQEARDHHPGLHNVIFPCL